MKGALLVGTERHDGSLTMGTIDDLVLEYLAYIGRTCSAQDAQAALAPLYYMANGMTVGAANEIIPVPPALTEVLHRRSNAFTPEALAAFKNAIVYDSAKGVYFVRNTVPNLPLTWGDVSFRVNQ